MKLNGQKVELPKPKPVIVPRGPGEDLIFYAGLVVDEQPFDAVCPMPQAPWKTVKGGESYRDASNMKYKETLDKYYDRKTNWMILESLKATPDLVWETVDYDNPETWGNFRGELEQSLTPHEQMELINKVIHANAITETMRKEAFARFTRREAEQAQSSTSQSSELENTKSGELAND